MKRAAVPLLMVLLSAPAGCGDEAGGSPEEARALVERAADARSRNDLGAFLACYSGEKAGRFREELAEVHGGDVEAFFASKRQMVVTGPVDLRRRAFATVQVFVTHFSGYKPWERAVLVFRDGRWQIDSFVPGDIDVPRTDRADADAVVQLVRAEAASPRPEGQDGAFQRLQILRALEVISVRELAGALPALADLARNDADGGIRQFAAHVLGRLKSRDALPVLVEALADPDLRVRGEAAAALAAVGALPGDAREALQRMAASDDSLWVRQQARAALEGAADRPAS